MTPFQIESSISFAPNQHAMGEIAHALQQSVQEGRHPTLGLFDLDMTFTNRPITESAYKRLGWMPLVPLRELARFKLPGADGQVRSQAEARAMAVFHEIDQWLSWAIEAAPEMVHEFDALDARYARQAGLEETEPTIYGTYKKLTQVALMCKTEADSSAVWRLINGLICPPSLEHLQTPFMQDYVPEPVHERIRAMLRQHPTGLGITPELMRAGGELMAEWAVEGWPFDVEIAGKRQSVPFLRPAAIAALGHVAEEGTVCAIISASPHEVVTGFIEKLQQSGKIRGILPVIATRFDYDPALGAAQQHLAMNGEEKIRAAQTILDHPATPDETIISVAGGDKVLKRRMQDGEERLLESTYNPVAPFDFSQARVNSDSFADWRYQNKAGQWLDPKNRVVIDAFTHHEDRPHQPTSHNGYATWEELYLRNLLERATTSAQSAVAFADLLNESLYLLRSLNQVSSAQQSIQSELHHPRHDVLRAFYQAAIHPETPTPTDEQLAHMATVFSQIVESTNFQNLGLVEAELARLEQTFRQAS
jgi:hypothetical protein